MDDLAVVCAIGGGLLGLLGVVVLLEVFFGHFPLYYHKAGVYKGLFEELALEHADEVFNTNVLARGALDDATIRLDLLLLRECLLRVRLALLGEGSLVLLEELGRLFQGVLRVLTVDALVVELGGRGLHL